MTAADIAMLVGGRGLRGVVPDEFDATTAYALGRGFVEALGDIGAPLRLVVGHDVRESSPELLAAFIMAAREQGVEVTSLGRCTADEVVYASGIWNRAAVYVTGGGAPAGSNGVRWWGPGARPLAPEVVTTAVTVARKQRHAAARAEIGPLPQRPGSSSVGEADEGVSVLGDLARVVRDLVAVVPQRSLRVVVDAGNGTAGQLVDAVLGDGAGLGALPVDVVPVFFEADGTFPYHDPDSASAANLVDLQAAVVTHEADLGFAFDGDASRCAIVDERGARVSVSSVMLLVGLGLVARARQNGGEPFVVVERSLSRAVSETLAGAGARPRLVTGGFGEVRREGVACGAILAGGRCGHLAFGDFFGSDSGSLLMMHVLATLAAQRLPLSELVEMVEPYATAEVRSTVTDVSAALERVVDAYVTRSGAGPVECDQQVDGTGASLHVSHWGLVPRWWFELRTESPGGRLVLTVEAVDEDIMAKVRDDVLALVRELDPAPDGEEETDD